MVEKEYLPFIKCPECNIFPLFDFNFEKNDYSIKYQCHNKNMEEISLDKFTNFFCKHIKCKECKIKDGEYKCYCGLFCKDDYLYHILISKHNQINIQTKIFKLENIFNYYCFDCKQIFDEEDKIHKNHNFINYEKFIKYLNNYVIFIFQNLKNQKFLHQKFNQILNSIFYHSLNYIEQKYYQYYLNLQNLIISMIHCLKNNIDNKKLDLNYIIAKYSIKNNLTKYIKILNEESVINEFCEIYLNKKKIGFEYKFNNEENDDILILFHKSLH